MCSCSNKSDCPSKIRSKTRLLKKRLRRLIEKDKSNTDYKNLKSSLSSTTCKIMEELELIEEYLKGEYKKHNIQW